MELRTKESSEFDTVSKDLAASQEACATAIKILKDYYGAGEAFVQTDATQPAGSAASSIIGMLEVAEADFSRNLAEATTTEDEKKDEYKKMIQDNAVSKAAKSSDIKNKESEVKSLDNLINETQMDVNDATSEKEAVVAYQSKLKKNCETKTPSYEERQARRKAEMDGLKNALAILNGDSVALMQNGVTLGSESKMVDDLLNGFK